MFIFSGRQKVEKKISEVKKTIADEKKSREKKRELVREIDIVNTNIKLDNLKTKYEKMLSVQRRVIKNNPTKSELRRAESRIRSGICACTIICEAKRQLDEIRYEENLQQMLGELNSALNTINRLAGGNLERTKRKTDKEMEKLSRRSIQDNPEDLFSEASLAQVDEWLGARFTDVANRYIQGESIENCMRASTFILDEDPMPYARMLDDDGKGGSASSSNEPDTNLDDLMSSSLFD